MTFVRHTPDTPDNVVKLREISDNIESEEGPPVDLSEDGIAQEFIARYGQGVRFVARWGRWMVWDGTRWILDDQQSVELKAQTVLRKVSKQEAANTWKREYNSLIGKHDSIKERRTKRVQAQRNALRRTRHIRGKRTRDAMLSMATPDTRIASIPDMWDGERSRHILNTDACSINTVTGEQYKHRPGDYITMRTRIAPSDAPTPLWTSFLGQITDGNRELQEYLQRMAGYFLTGETTEQALFFGYGKGSNGKSVLLNTLGSILGDYHTAAPIETFIFSHHDRHLTELANLRGARLVTSSETEEGRRWAEARLKMLTGGERISARFMRQDLFEFTPQFKLFIIGNHKPRLKSVDEAIRRRFHLIPFTVTIPKHKRDAYITQKLQTEWPGILQWMIDGCRAWRDQGLAPPKSVVDATDAYMAQEDAMTVWFRECCSADDASAFTPISELYASWEAWCKGAGEPALNVRVFADNLKERAELFRIEYRRTSAHRGYQRCALREPNK